MDVTGRGANGSVASPSRLANGAARTRPPLGHGAEGSVAIRYGDAGPFFMQRDLTPDDTGLGQKLYQVDKQFRFPNIAGILKGNIPVPYDPALSRVLGGVGKGPAAPFTASVKTYDNNSWRLEFRQWAQRFPAGPLAPGRGRLLYNNRYYPGNYPSQLVQGNPGAGNAVAGQGGAPRSASPKFVQNGGRGMASMYANRSTRLAPAISYSSTTQTIGNSIFTEGPLGTGGVSGG